MQKVSFLSQGVTIRGALAMPSRGEAFVPGVIIFHGMTSSHKSYRSLITKLSERGIAGLAISMRGHGQSGGDFNKDTVAEAIDDALAAYDFLVQQPGIDADNIGLVGSSVGAILAAMTIVQRTVRSLIFRAPAAYTEEMMQLSMAGTMVNEKSQFHEIKSLAGTPAGRALREFDGSLLVVASGRDAIIPLSVSEGYVSMASRADKKQLRVVPGAAHTLTKAQKESFNQMAADWFAETLFAGGGAARSAPGQAKDRPVT